jgi:hypothetical protein
MELHQPFLVLLLLMLEVVEAVTHKIPALPALLVALVVVARVDMEPHLQLRWLGFLVLPIQAVEVAVADDSKEVRFH